MKITSICTFKLKDSKFQFFKFLFIFILRFVVVPSFNPFQFQCTLNMKRKLEKIPRFFSNIKKHENHFFFNVGCRFFMHWHIDKRTFSAEQVHESFLFLYVNLKSLFFFMLAIFHGLILSRSPLKKRKKRKTLHFPLKLEFSE